MRSACASFRSRTASPTRSSTRLWPARMTSSCDAFARAEACSSSSRSCCTCRSRCSATEQRDQLLLAFPVDGERPEAGEVERPALLSALQVAAVPVDPDRVARPGAALAALDLDDDI